MRTLIYDGQCRLCVTAKAGLERLGPGPPHSDIRFVPYQSEEAACQLGAEYKPGRPDVAFLVEPDGTISRGLDDIREQPADKTKAAAHVGWASMPPMTLR